MKRLITLITILFTTFFASAQTYQNNWIDYNKTYYKFSVIDEGLYRIPKATLDAAGLGNVPAKDFQLWRNGTEQVIYVSTTNGVIGAQDFIEFYGIPNDGKPDAKLYQNPDYQLSDHYSLFSDTASYFLTVNTNGNNKRYSDAVNDVQNNTLQPDKYFMYTAGNYYRELINGGYNVLTGGVRLYSSIFDVGEGFASAMIPGKGFRRADIGNLRVYQQGPDGSIAYSIVGVNEGQHDVSVAVENNTLDNFSISDFGYAKRRVSVPTSLLTNPNTVRIQVNNLSTSSTNRIEISYVELTYPRTFDFLNATNFSFNLAATNNGNFLQISNFNSGSTEPILLDETDLKRYKGDISQAGTVKLALPASQQPQRIMHLGSTASGAIHVVGSMTERKFVDYSQKANQGDYIIVSNPKLYTSSNGKNNVEDYRQYRNSSIGGGFNSIIVDINEIQDQFSYGIFGNPLGIKEFVQFAADRFSPAPKDIFIIGKGIDYTEVFRGRNSPDVSKFTLIPTYGSPGSDILFSAPYIGPVVPRIPIGRISAINGDEVGSYLDKMKEYENLELNPSGDVDDDIWRKEVMQVIGGKDESENSLFRLNMEGYKSILEGPQMGAYTELFSKSSNAAVQLANSQRLDEMMNNGVGILSYFGHSSATELDYNLNDPDVYHNAGRYPMFIVSGCTVGNNFIFDPNRLTDLRKGTVSEKFVLAPNRGSIGFMASTHYGITSYLDRYNKEFFRHLSSDFYGYPVGVLMQKTNQSLYTNNTINFFSRIDMEQMNLNGDPARKIYAQPKPDYVINESSISINPSFISVANQKFNVSAIGYNLGRALSDSLTWEVKRQWPDGSEKVIYKTRRLAPLYMDSISISVPIVSITDKGLNKITVTIDADNEIPEMFETNNSFTKDIFIFENEATPIFPSNYAIINTNNQKLYASTADPLIDTRNYVFELDTTELFNSSLKITKQISSIGGILEFDPGIQYEDSTVYYWRVMEKSDTTTAANAHWNGASFIYLKNSSTGSNQSGYFQHLGSDFDKIGLNDDRKWVFNKLKNFLHTKGGVFPTAFSLGTDFEADVNDAPFVTSVCGVSGIVISVLNPRTLKPMLNSMTTPLFGSDIVCGADRLANFQFNILSQQKRIDAYHFLKDSIPDGSIVFVRNISGTNPATNTYAQDWKGDESVLGQGNSLYDILKENGLSDIDSFYRPRAFVFIYQKNGTDFNPAFKFSDGISDQVEVTVDFESTDSIGYIKSPVFGPAVSWKEMNWSGHEMNNQNTANPIVSIVGITNSNQETVLGTVGKNDKTFNLSAVSAAQYPFIRLDMRNADSTNFYPYQLDYWRLNFVPAPEGALDPKLVFQSKDTLTKGEPLNFKIAFKNISNQNFDSLRVKVSVTNSKNEVQNIAIPLQKALVSGDTVSLSFIVDTKNLAGKNTLYVDFNPDNDQPEQFHFNNFLYHEFYVNEDYFNPTLDVTFDGIHILNQDIVSAKPHIVVRLTDNNKFIELKDTSLIKVQLSYTDENQNQILRTIPFDNDTLRLTPSTERGGEAVIDYLPFFDTDNDYELIVSGKDASGNESGSYDYHVSFKVIGEAMITDMLNYPNPFTTSTAFVFTLTGSEVPQNIRIQILTITGKIVREITKDELGPLHIGRNITEFKWDGTDMYGQKLGNGVYLYRVLTNLNGKSLKKYKGGDYNLDGKGFFKGGYGKMYLMR